jgi:Spy/CpxP family protein refolding chaperone
MKVTKPMIIAALIAGNLLTCNLALRAADTNKAPSTPPAGAPPQGQRPQGMMRGGPSVDQLAQQLNLTEDQKTKVKPIIEGSQQKMRDLRADTSLSQEDRRTKMMGIREGTTAQMKTVLTAEQFDQWEKMTQRRRPPGGPPSGGEKAGSTNAPAAPLNK